MGDWGAGFATGIALIFLDMNGTLSTIARDTLYFRATVTFIVSLSVTVLVSMLKKEPYIETTVKMRDDQLSLPGKNTHIKIMALLLIVSSLSMYLFLTIIF